MTESYKAWRKLVTAALSAGLDLGAAHDWADLQLVSVKHPARWPDRTRRTSYDYNNSRD